MKRIIEFFKKLFKIKQGNNINENIINNDYNIKNINWNLINNLKENDIVLVKMDNKTIERDNIEKMHQKRPFLIQLKQDEYQEVVGYYLTSNLNHYFFNKKENKALKVILNKDNYYFHKNSLIIYDEEIRIPYENIIHFLSHLNKDDLKKLKKYRQLFWGNTIQTGKNNFFIDIGDIVLDNEKAYIIYQMDNVHCYGYHISTTRKHVDVTKNLNYIYFDNQLYYIDYNDYKTFNNDDTLQVIKRFNEDIVNLIRINKKTIKYNEKNKIKKKR